MQLFRYLGEVNYVPHNDAGAIQFKESSQNHCFDGPDPQAHSLFDSRPKIKLRIGARTIRESRYLTFPYILKSVCLCHFLQSDFIIFYFEEENIGRRLKKTVFGTGSSLIRVLWW